MKMTQDGSGRGRAMLGLSLLTHVSKVAGHHPAAGKADRCSQPPSLYGWRPRACIPNTPGGGGAVGFAPCPLWFRKGERWEVGLSPICQARRRAQTGVGPTRLPLCPCRRLVFMSLWFAFSFSVSRLHLFLRPSPDASDLR